MRRTVCGKYAGIDCNFSGKGILVTESLYCIQDEIWNLMRIEYEVLSA